MAEALAFDSTAECGSDEPTDQGEQDEEGAQVVLDRIGEEHASEQETREGKRVGDRFPGVVDMRVGEELHKAADDRDRAFANIAEQFLPSLAHHPLDEHGRLRNDFLRSLYGGLKALGIGISQDLVDKMTDQDAPTMPTVEGRGLGAENLATVQ